MRFPDSGILPMTLTFVGICGHLSPRSSVHTSLYSLSRWRAAICVTGVLCGLRNNYGARVAFWHLGASTPPTTPKVFSCHCLPLRAESCFPSSRCARGAPIMKATGASVVVLEAVSTAWVSGQPTAYSDQHTSMMIPN